MTVFSYTYKLEIDGAEYETFGDMRMSFAVDGLGLSGLCTATFSVAIPSSDFAGASSSAEVVLTCTSNSTIEFPTFYLSGRSANGKAVVLSCVDRMMFTDQMYAIADTAYDSNGEILTINVLNDISGQCGFNSGAMFLGVKAINAIPKLKKEQTYKRQCSDILSMVATACGGYWFTYNNNLIFKPFGTSPYLSGVPAVKHTAVVNGGTKGPISNLYMTGNGDTAYGQAGSASNTIKIDTPMVSAALAGAVEEVVEEYTYNAWSCDKALLDSCPTFDTAIDFADGETRLCNNATISITGSGLYATLSSNEVSEDEFDYSGQLKRDILNRIAFGERRGGIQINPDGKIVTYVDKNKYV